MANSNSGLNGFGAVGQFAIGEADEVASVAPALGPPTFDYPNPRGYRQPIDTYNFTLGVNLSLLGADKFFGAGPPTYDYPNPRGYVPASVLRTWVLPLNLNLVGADHFFGAGGPNYDYPNPKGKARSIDNWTWTWPTNPLTVIPPKFNLAGNPNYDQPNPRGPRRAVDLLSWIFPTVIVNQKILIPYIPNYDQPNPNLGKPYPVILRGWVMQGNIQLGPGFGIPTLAFSSEQAAVLCTASDSQSGQNWSGPGYMAKYEIDTTIQIEGIFTNALANVNVDPDEVILYMLDPAGGLAEHTTLDGSIVRNGLGHYYFTFTPNKSGVWTYKWAGVGVAEATSPDTTFTVNASALIAG